MRGFIAALAFCALLQAHGEMPNCPAAKGAYLLQGEDWKAVDSVHSIGFKTTNVMGAAFSYGAAKAKVKAQFRDGRSPYQLAGKPFAMCLVNVVDTGRDITLARFQEEKDRRELSMASYRLWTGVNAQIDPASVIPTTVEKKADGVYEITAKEAFKPGEFILFTIVPDVSAMVKANTPGSLGGYDFGSHSEASKK